MNRKTKMVCTIGPKTCDYDSLLKLAKGGMNVVRLNMSHGTHEWHQATIDAIKKIRADHGYNLALMIDTKGPEVRTSDIAHPVELKTGDHLTITIERMAEYPANTIGISYDDFVIDVDVGDQILIDSGLMTLQVVSKTDTSVILESLDDGSIGSRRHVNIRGKSANLPAITEKDWQDIEFGIKNGVEFFALSFVNDAETVQELREYIKKHNGTTKIVSKIESTNAIHNLEAIVQASDGIMVARGDLGAELPYEEIPVIQERIVKLSRHYHKPVIVATQLLESMMVNPTPTRAEVTDIHTAVLQGADATMMSGETANGNHPYKAQQVMHNVVIATEKQMVREPVYNIEMSNSVGAEMSLGAVVVANNINADAMIVFSETGKTATYVSESRPDAATFVFTGSDEVTRQLALTWGVEAQTLRFNEEDPEQTIQEALRKLRESGDLFGGQQVVIVSHLRTPEGNVHGVQVRKV
jgi:pyruvate kinase